MDYNTLGEVPSATGLEVEHMALKRGTIDMDEARELRRQHEAGMSVLKLARMHGVERVMIIPRIIAAGGEVRGRSAANRVRMNREGVEGRKRLTEAAHEARRGTKVPEDELLRRASTKNKLRGLGEKVLIEALEFRGLPTEAQRPCGKYNIDVAVGAAVAVELVTQGNFRLRSPRFAERFKYLTNQGYNVIFVTFRHDWLRAMIGNLDDVLALVELVYRYPPARRKHWMIRCSLERFARVRNERGQIAAIPTPIRFFNFVRELHPR